MSQFLIGLCLIFAVVTSSALDIPEFLHICPRSHPTYYDCVKDSVHHLRPFLATGVPEYNIPTLEPLLLKEVVLTENTGGIRLTGTNVKAYGSSDFTVEKIDVDFDNLLFHLEILLPHLYVDAEYNMDGKILLLPISGNGQLTGNFTECTATVKFTAKTEIDPSGAKKVRVTEFTLKVVVSKGSLKFDNLFNGEKILGDMINNAINSNFDTFVRELMPLVENALADAFLDIINGIVTSFTYDQLFPN